MQCIPSAISPSIDWLTLTSTDGPKSLELLSLGKTLVALSSSHDNKAEKWHWRNYVGEHCLGVSYGERDDSVILQLSGIYAHDWFDQAYKLGTNCTRIDLAVSVLYDPEREGVADGAYKSGVEWQDKRGLGPGFTFLTNSAGGQTCYVGSRVSDIYGRIYDKWRESKQDEWRGWWRWEMECKGQVACRAAESIAANALRAGSIASTVRNYFTRRGCEPDWEVESNKLRVAHIRPVTTVASRLRWLNNQVRPGVQWLCANGYESMVLEALGLPMSAAKGERIRRLARMGNHTNVEEEICD